MSISENGKSKKIGPILLSGSGGDQFFLCRYNQNEQSYSDKIAYEIDQEMQSFIEYCYDRAKNILLENKDKLELIAKTLLDIETLDERQIKGDRKSTRLNSSHVAISYAVFCLKKKTIVNAIETS